MTKEIRSQIDILLTRMMYWRKRCKLAEKYIKELPCDPDITDKQWAAHTKWQKQKELKEPK